MSLDRLPGRVQRKSGDIHAAVNTEGDGSVGSDKVLAGNVLSCLVAGDPHVNLRRFENVSQVKFDGATGFGDRQSPHGNAAVFGAEIDHSVRLNREGPVDLFEVSPHFVVEFVERKRIGNLNIECLAGTQGSAGRPETVGCLDEQDVRWLDDVVRQRDLLEFARSVVIALRPASVASAAPRATTTG